MTRLRPLLFFFFLSFVSAQQIAPQATARAYLNQGAKYREANDFPRAIETLKRAISLDPSLTAAYFQLGVAYYQASQYQSALAALQQANRLKPSDADQLFWLGATFYQLKQFPNALTTLQQAVRLNPTDANNYHWLGETYLHGFAQYDKAVAAFVESRRLDPSDAKNHNELGLAYDQSRQYEKALAEFKEAVRLKPAEPLYQSNLGIAYLRLDRKNEAQQIYRTLATLDKTKAQSLYDLINKPAGADFGYSIYNVQMLVQAMGTTFESWDAIDTAANLPANMGAAQAALAEGDKLRRTGKTNDEAIAAYRRATHVRADPAILARSYLGQALVFGKTSEQRPKAVQLLRQVLRFSPDNADASMALAQNYAFLLEWPNALEAVQQTIRLKPNDAPPRYWLGWIYLHGIGNSENAVAAYLDELRLKPADERALTDLGVAYLYNGQYANASGAFRRAIRLDATDSDPYWFLGITFLKMGNKPQAQRVYQTLQRMDKDLAKEFAERM
jgi:tetratricopeptide (TPR) repeat protein